MPNLAAPAPGFSASSLNLPSIKAPARSGQLVKSKKIPISPFPRRHPQQQDATSAPFFDSRIAATTHVKAQPKSTRSTAMRGIPCADHSWRCGTVDLLELQLGGGHKSVGNASIIRGLPVQNNKLTSRCLTDSLKINDRTVLGRNLDVANKACNEYLKEHLLSLPIVDDSTWSEAKLYITPSQPFTCFVKRGSNLANVHQG